MNFTALTLAASAASDPEAAQSVRGYSYYATARAGPV